MDTNIIISLVVGSLAFIGSMVSLYFAVKKDNARMPSQNEADQAKAAFDRSNALRTLQDLVNEQATRIDELQTKLEEVARRPMLPFRLIIEGVTSPEPAVLKADIELLPTRISDSKTQPRP